LVKHTCENRELWPIKWKHVELNEIFWGLSIAKMPTLFQKSGAFSIHLSLSLSLSLHRHPVDSAKAEGEQLISQMVALVL